MHSRGPEKICIFAPAESFPEVASQLSPEAEPAAET